MCYNYAVLRREGHEREPQGSREDSAPDAHLINFLPDPNAGIGGMIYVYADYFP